VDWVHVPENRDQVICQKYGGRPLASEDFMDFYSIHRTMCRCNSTKFNVNIVKFTLVDFVGSL
jgi:hypothetical protein